MNRKRLLAVAVILLFGAARLPVEHHLGKRMIDDGLQEPPIELGFRERLPQIGFMAALGGLRSLAASIFDLKAHIAFENNEWFANEQLYDLITALQPRRDSYWETGGWHRLRNASGHYRYRADDLPQSIRDRNIAYFSDSGFELLDLGLRTNPDSADLHASMAGYVNTLSVHSVRKDGRKAAGHYQRAFELTGREFYERMAAYERAKLPDLEDKTWAYETLLRHYRVFAARKDDRRGVPLSVRRTIGDLENALAIPLLKRIPQQQQAAPPGAGLVPESPTYERLQKNPAG